MRLLSMLAGLLLIGFSTYARASDPPAGAELYIVYGYSEMKGHDSMSTQENRPNCSHTWYYNNSGVYEQCPAANRPGADGPSPAPYFADELITLGKATDVIFVNCEGSTGDWHDGIAGFKSTAGINSCITKIAPPLAAGYVLSGVFTACCAGDSLTDGKVDAFPDRYRDLVSGMRTATGIGTLFFVSALTPRCTPCSPGDPDLMDRILTLKSKQAATTPNNVDWISSPNGCISGQCPWHENGHVQADIGRNAASHMP